MFLLCDDNDTISSVIVFTIITNLDIFNPLGYYCNNVHSLICLRPQKKIFRKVLENLKEMFYEYYIHCDFCNMFKFLNMFIQEIFISCFLYILKRTFQNFRRTSNKFCVSLSPLWVFGRHVTS